MLRGIAFFAIIPHMSKPDIFLAPGEKGIYSISFRPNLLLFWLKSTFLITNKRIAVKAPNTIFGVIPLGYEENAMPMGSVAGVTSSVEVKAGRLIGFGLLSLLFLALTFSDGFSFFFFLLFLIFGALAGNAILAGLTVTNNGGGKSTATVSILDKAALDQFKNKANEYIYSASTGGVSWNDAISDHGQPQGFQQPQNGFSTPQNGFQGHPQEGAYQNYAQQQGFPGNSQQGFSNPAQGQQQQNSGQQNSPFPTNYQGPVSGQDGFHD